MIEMVSNVNIVANSNLDINSQSKGTSDNDFKQILNKQREIDNKEKNVKRPTKEIKTNSSKKIKKLKKTVQSNKKEISTDELNNVEEAIIEKVTETLGISEDQLKEILSELEITVFDLLLPDKLDAFLTTLYNVDNTFDLLSKPDVINNIRQLKTQLKDLINSFHLDNEAIKDIISKAHNEALTEDLEVQEQLPTNNNSKDNEQQQKTPTVEVTDERDTTRDATSETTRDTAKDTTKDTTKHTISEATDDNSKDVIAKSDIISDSQVDFNNELNVVDQNVQKIEIINNNGTKEIIAYNVNTQEVIEQIVSSVKVELNDDKSTMMIQLRPEHLGKLSFSLTSENGVITANFMAENPAVKELIEANLAQLRVSLQEQGIDVDKLEVNVADNNMFNQDNNKNNFANQSNKKKRAARMMDIAINSTEEVDNIEDDNNSILESNESGRIDYSV